MIKSYKKRFVIMTMLLIGAILTVVFSGLGVYFSFEIDRSLRETMHQVSRPFDMKGIVLADGSEEDLPKVDNRGEKSDDFIKSDDMRNEMFSDSFDYAIYNYDSQTGNITTVTSADFLDENDLSEVLKCAVESKDNYGKLSKYGVVFLVDKSFDEQTFTIVLTEKSLYNVRLLRDIGFLFGTYAILMLSFYIISRKLSSVASKPLEEAIELEKQFVTDVSHDLKTPITVILANNSIIKSSPDTAVSEQMQWINSTDSAARNMLEMINEMLKFSSLEAERPNQQLSLINASSEAEKCVLQFESVAYDKGIEFTSDIDEEIYIHSTEDHTDRIFNSILENAFKYEPNGGMISLSLKREKKKAVFKVRNFGSFISEEDLPHIFERFYRADKTRNEQKGHGLGLPIVKHITSIINAKIYATSTKELGTEFTVVFDLSDK